MIHVTLNGSDFPCPTESFRSLGELIEFVKANIDPDSFLLNLTVNSREVEDREWRAPLASLGELRIDVETGNLNEFLIPRLEVASLYVDKIREEFVKVQGAFRGGANVDSHNQLSTAVQDLKAFVDWYENLVQMLPQDRSSERGGYYDQVKRISEVCEQILQQQTFRAWWALADTIERRLDPELERLKGCCVRVANG